MYWIKNTKTGEVIEAEKAVAKPLIASGDFVEIDPNAKVEEVPAPIGKAYPGDVQGDVAVPPAPETVAPVAPKPAVKKPAKK